MTLQGLNCYKTTVVLRIDKYACKVIMAKLAKLKPQISQSLNDTFENHPSKIHQYWSITFKNNLAVTLNRKI